MSRKRKPKALIYCRQSVARNDSISIELQETSTRAYAASKGYEVVDVIAEEGVSGYKDWKKRPRFPSILESGVDVVLIYRWSRLSRRRLDQAVILDLLEKAGIHVECSTESVDPTTAGGRLSRNVMLDFAEFESAVKSEQIREAHQRRLSRGLTQHGRPRFAYDWVDSVTYAPREPEASLLRECYERYVAGAGFTALAVWMNQQGAKTTRGNSLTGLTLRQIMDSGFGAAKLVQGTETPGPVTYLPGAHPAVVSEETWDAYLAARARRRTEPPKKRVASWFLTGLAKCGYCGRSLNRSGTNGSTYARCALRGRGGDCVGVNIPLHQIEGRVGIWLGGRVDKLAAMAPSRDEARAAEQKKADRLTAELDQIGAKLGRLASGWGDGLLDDDGYRAARDAALAEKELVVADLERSLAELSLLGEATRDMYDVLIEEDPMTPGEWGARVGRLLRRVEVFRDKIVFTPVVGEPEEEPRG